MNKFPESTLSLPHIGSGISDTTYLIYAPEIDWFRFMLVYGVPVGIPHMFIIIPWHWDLSGILGMAALCVIVGGIFGCVIAAWLGIRAVWYMVGFPISKIVAIHKRTC